MSKRFYVIYTLKEFMIPRVFKTKATLLKYLDENKSLQFKQFNNLAEAYNFSREIQKQVETKFNLKVEKYLENSMKDHKINPKNQNTIEREVVHQSTTNNKISEPLTKEKKTNNQEIQSNYISNTSQNISKVPDLEIKNQKTQNNSQVKITNEHGTQEDGNKKELKPETVIKKNQENAGQQTSKIQKQQIPKSDKFRQKQQSNQQIKNKHQNQNTISNPIRQSKVEINKQKIQNSNKFNFQKIGNETKYKNVKQFSEQQSYSHFKKEKYKKKERNSKQIDQTQSQQNIIRKPIIRQFDKFSVNTLQNLSERSVRQLNRIDKKLNRGTKQSQYTQSFQGNKFQNKKHFDHQNKAKLRQSEISSTRQENTSHFKLNVNNQNQKIGQSIINQQKQKQKKKKQEEHESTQFKLKEKIIEQVRVNLKRVQEQLKNDSTDKKIHELQKNDQQKNIKQLHLNIPIEEKVMQAVVLQKDQLKNKTQAEIYGEKQSIECIKSERLQKTLKKQDESIISDLSRNSNQSPLSNLNEKKQQFHHPVHQHVEGEKQVNVGSEKILLSQSQRAQTINKNQPFGQGNQKCEQQFKCIENENFISKSINQLDLLKKQQNTTSEQQEQKIENIENQKKKIQEADTHQIKSQNIEISKGNDLGLKENKEQQMNLHHQSEHISSKIQTQLVVQPQIPVQIYFDNTIPQKQITLAKQQNKQQFSIIDGQSLSNTFCDPSLNTQFLNIHSLFIQSKLLDLPNSNISENFHLKNNKRGILKINLTQNQNPGYSFVSYQLDINGETVKKLELLGVKSKAVAQALSITKGLQLSSKFNLSQVKIQSSFPFHNISKYEHSIDKVVRKVMQDSKFYQTKINRIDYL